MALGDIDEALARDAAPLEAPPKPRRRLGARWLAAAVAAALLTGTALAAANGGFGIWAVQRDEGYYRQVLSASVKHFTAGDFAADVLAFPDGLPIRSVELGSLWEAADYLGYPIAQNSLLDSADPLPGPARCTLRINRTGMVGDIRDPAGLSQIYLSSAVVIDGVSVNLTATFTTTEQQSRNYPNGFPLAEGYTARERTLPNGVKAVLVLPPEDMEPSPTAYRTHPVAYFVYEGACYELYLWGAQAMRGHPENDPPDLDWEGVFYRVLDAFQ
ncbi:MAG: hypothetical protein HFF21_10260 [Oscillospiraceae bacterium]|nr:hypothetical protein [Oscillospiraceae bacterium]